MSTARSKCNPVLRKLLCILTNTVANEAVHYDIEHVAAAPPNPIKKMYVKDENRVTGQDVIPL